MPLNQTKYPSYKTYSGIKSVFAFIDSFNTGNLVVFCN